MAIRYSKGEFTIVPNKSLRRGLPPTEQVVLMWLAEHSDDNDQSYPTRSTLADECGVTVRTLDRALASLIERELIVKSARFNQNRQTSNMYEVVISAPSPATIAQGGDNLDTPGATKTARGRATKTAHRTQPIRNSTQLTQEDTGVSMSNSSELRQLHDEICKLFGKNPNSYKFSDKRRKNLTTRLRDSGREVILNACAAITQSAFHMGENDRGWSADPYWCLSSFEKAEEWAGKFEQSNKYTDLSKLEF